MNQPALFVLNQTPVLGELAASSIFSARLLCEQCGMRAPIGRYDRVAYRLDFWDGEDIFQGHQLYVVSERLRDALLQNEIRGAAFERIEVLTGEHFASGPGALPAFYRPIIEARAKGPEIWWKRVPCEHCDKSKWDLTDAGILALSAPFNTEPVPARTVYRDSWAGDDIFYLEDPAMPIVSARVVDILRRYNADIHLLDSGWA